MKSLVVAIACLISMPSLADSSDNVRVRIFYSKSPVRLDATGPYQFQLKRGGKVYSESASTRVRALHGKMVFGHQSLKGDVLASPVNSTDILRLNGRRYRGALVFHPLGGSRFDVIEHVDLDEYLYGVLPREVGSDWPLDALKAQAVVSRTYALSNKITNANERFDLSDSVRDQVYGGMEAEAQESNRAVQQSHGEVLTDSSGRPIQSFFHSSCGGRTERPEHVWKSLAAGDVFGCVEDTFCEADPHYSWQLTLSYSAVRARLRKAGIHVREIKKITIVKKSDSDRVEVFGVQSSRGLVEVGGNRFRLALGPEALRSTLITNLKAGKSHVSFEGRGWGHGVGLCQWGARGRALAGQSYKQILETYYPKATLSTL